MSKRRMPFLALWCAVVLVSCGAPSVLDAEQSATVLTSPYAPRAHVFRGQLHAHTNASDGKQDAATVLRAYRAAGYDFVAITDHNLVTPNPGVPGILHIPGSEDNRNYACLHVNRVGATGLVATDASPQDIVDHALAEGAFVQINHPDWPGSYPTDPCWSDEALAAMRGMHAVEVWNGLLNPRKPHYEQRIDPMLSRGQRVFLTAVDDCHDVRSPRCMRASVMVFADELTREAVVESLRGGNFYASNGARIDAISVHGALVSVTLPEHALVEFVVRGGRVAARHSGVTHASYAVRVDDQYVRIRIRNIRGGRAWSNPMYVER